jgi:hypothetical protein
VMPREETGTVNNTVDTGTVANTSSSSANGAVNKSNNRKKKH